MAPIALLSAFGNNGPVLAVYVPVVASVVQVGTVVLRPFTDRPSRVVAWAYSLGSALVIALLMFGWSRIRLSKVEVNTGLDRIGTFRGWEPEQLWLFLLDGWVIGFVVSFAAYLLLTRSTAPRTAATAA